MPQKQGDHLNVGEIKSSIIMFILQTMGPVGEPAIRDFLLKKYDVINQGTINRHLHDLQKLDCIELIPPQKKGLRNYWDITKIKNLKKIRKEFPELRLNTHEKAILLILRGIWSARYKEDSTITYLEISYSTSVLDWLKLYIQLLMSTSFFNACIEVGIIKLYERIYKIYTTSNGSYRYQRINELLIVCYKACVKYYPDFKISEKEFADAMNAEAHHWETIQFLTKGYFSKFIKNSFPGLPEEMFLLISKTRFSEIEKIPEKIPGEINDKDLVNYMLNTISLIIDQEWHYMFSKNNLLLEHFLNQDILFGVDSDDEHDLVKKTIKNHTLPSRFTKPNHLIIQQAALADSKPVSDIIYKYKQPAQFSDGSNNPDEINQKVLKYYSDLIGND